ncbi:hypothetical protein PVAND_000923 [Polypedilum vanderplanki]|uniref:Odorant receptor n=1 Tax=Polypedilum vanderplanki TaxID=319348 RepID=A0A9J6BMK2_POLVA|nr:hypothetical protein PVAND_000923 [Polypedilum vanderplanki]
MKPSEKFTEIYNYSVSFGKVLGFDMTKSKFKLNIRSATVVIYIILTEIMIFHSIYDNWPHFAKIIHALTTEGGLIIQFSRITCFALFREFQQQISVNTLNNLRNFEVNHRYSEILNKSLRQLELVIKIYVLISIVNYTFSSIFSVYQFLVNGKYELQVLIYMPFINHEEVYGYLFNFFFQCGIAFLAYDGLLTYDLFPIMYSFHVKGHAEILIEKLKEFENDLKQVKNESTEILPSTSKKIQQKQENSQTDVKKKLIKFINEYEFYAKYVKELNEYQVINSFVSTAIIAIALCFGVYIMTKVSFSSGLTVTGSDLIEMILPCAYGTLVAYQNKKLLKAINSFPWYELPLESQKIYLQFIQICQNTPKIETMIFDLFNFASEFGKKIGYNTTQSEFSINHRMLITTLYGFLGQIMIFNTIYDNWPQLDKIIQALLFQGAFIIINVRIICYAFERELQSHIPVISLKIIQRYEENHRFSELLHKNLDQNKKVVKTYIFISTFLFGITAIVLSLQIILTGKLQQQALVYLPYLDHENAIGYFINFVFLCGISILGFLGFMPYDLFLIIYGFTVKGHADILIEMLKEFENDIKSETDENLIILPSTSNETFQELRNTQNDFKKLLNFIKEYELYWNYVNEFNCFQSIISFISIGVIAVALCISLYMITKISFVTGISASGIYVCQMILPCVVGAMITNQNFRLLDAVNNFPWYDLSINNQKIFLQIIQIFQNIPSLKIIIFDELNLELLKNVVNASYSYYVFLNKMT